MPGEQCWRLGMVVSELITNASRHAFGDGGGAIRIELLNHGASVECRVADNGSASTIVRPGRGLKIIQLLAENSTEKSSRPLEPSEPQRLCHFRVSTMRRSECLPRISAQ